MRNEQNRTDCTAVAEGRRGLLFVVSGPSGVGKDTLLDRLFERLPGIARSVSATTRERRPGEIDGRDYQFVQVAQFQADVAAGRFLEYATYGESLYGTPADRVEQQRGAGIDVILKIEVQGALQVKALVPDAVMIFIAPPSFAELERRLYARNTDTEERVGERLAIAQEEMHHVPQYDYVVVNDKVVRAVAALRCIVVAERHRIHR